MESLTGRCSYLLFCLLFTWQPHKSQKWIYKIKMLQTDQFIVSNFMFNICQIRLFDLVIKFKVM